jgi:hypothetical protein
MRLYIALSVAAAIAFAAAACSKPATAPEAPPPPAQTVFDPLTNDLDKAKQVQGVIDQQADAARRAVAAQEK